MLECSKFAHYSDWQKRDCMNNIPKQNIKNYLPARLCDKRKGINSMLGIERK